MNHCKRGHMKYTSKYCQFVGLSGICLGLIAHPAHGMGDQIDYTGSLGWVDTSGSAIDVAVSGGVAYIADDLGGLVIVDVSNPAAPIMMSQMAITGGGDEVQVVGNIAYVSSHSTGTIWFIDVSDPANPTQVGLLDVGVEFSSVAVNGSTLALSAGFTQLRVYDISNLASIVMVDLVDGMEVSAIEFAGDLMYVLRQSGFAIFDTSDPASPFETGSTPNGGDQLTIANGYAYVMTQSLGISTFAVSDPTQPMYLETAYGVIPGGLFDLVHEDGSLYVLDYPSMYQFNLSDPTHPARDCWQFQQGTPSSLAIDDQILYIASGENGLQIVDTAEFCDGCEADFTEDGVLDFFDVSMFLTFYSGSHPLADFTRDETIDFFDISAFLATFASGCP